MESRMQAHPEFINYNIPRKHVLGDFHLNVLTVKDVDRDFEAVMESVTEIKATYSTSSWPDGLTLEENYLDLAWHQKEFDSKRSFTWVIEGANSAYLGCLYIYPSIIGERSADVKWWWRAGADVDQEKFKSVLAAWLETENWPPLEYKFP